jgi:transcription antitermination factor NusG
MSDCVPLIRDDFRWHALYTSPRAEKRVRDRLLERMVETYLPLHRCTRVWSDRIKIIEEPLFRSYIFVHCHESELYDLVRIRGVVRVIYYCGRPAVVRASEILAIKEFLELAVELPLSEGEEVEILTGALKHVPGKIRRIRKNRLELYIEELGCRVSVDLGSVARKNKKS